MRKVRIVMAEKKLDYQFEIEDVWASDAILESNPLGKVPCLVMEGGEAVFDSRVIVEYLDTRSPLARLIPEPNRERTEVRTWEALADGMLDAAILARLEATWAGRTAEQRSQAWIDRQMSKIDASLAAMSTGLADKPWCTGIHMTLADIAVGCALGYLEFRFPQIAWRERPNLARLADKLNARQSFIDTRARRSLTAGPRRGRSRGGARVRCARAGGRRRRRIRAEAVRAGHRPVGAEHLLVQVAVEQLAGLHERQQVGEQLDAVLGVAPDDVVGGDLAGSSRPAACTSSFSAISVFWWKW